MNILPRKQYARVLVEKDGRLLILHNMKDGRNRWEFPGGKLDENESFVHAAVRELQEETGLITTQKNLVWFNTANIEIDGALWTGCYYYPTWYHGEPMLREPEKFADMRWVTIAELERLPQIPLLTVNQAKFMLLYRKFGEEKEKWAIR